MQINYQTTLHCTEMQQWDVNGKIANKYKIQVATRNKVRSAVDLVPAWATSTFTRCRCCWRTIWIEYNEMESMNLQWRNLQAFKMFSFLLSALSVRPFLVSVWSGSADSICREKFPPFLTSRVEPDCSRVAYTQQNGKTTDRQPPSLWAVAAPFGAFSNKRKHWNHIVLRNKSIICVFFFYFCAAAMASISVSKFLTK